MFNSLLNLTDQCIIHKWSKLLFDAKKSAACLLNQITELCLLTKWVRPPIYPSFGWTVVYLARYVKLPVAIVIFEFIVSYIFQKEHRFFFRVKICTNESNYSPCIINYLLFHWKSSFINLRHRPDYFKYYSDILFFLIL